MERDLDVEARRQRVDQRFADVTMRTLELLSKDNEIVPNANKRLAEALSSTSDSLAVAVAWSAESDSMADAPPRGRARFGKLYVFAPSALQMDAVEGELRQAYIDNGLHGAIGPVLNRSEVVGAIMESCGIDVSELEASFFTWGYETPCSASSI